MKKILVLIFTLIFLSANAFSGDDFTDRLFSQMKYGGTRDILKSLGELRKLPFELDAEKNAIIRSVLSRNISHKVNMGCADILVKFGPAAQDALPELLYVINETSPRSSGALRKYFAALASMSVISPDVVGTAMRFYKMRNQTLKLYAAGVILTATKPSDTLYQESHRLLFSRLLDDDEDVRHVALIALEKVSRLPEDISQAISRMAENPSEHRNNRKLARSIKVNLQGGEHSVAATTTSQSRNAKAVRDDYATGLFSKMKYGSKRDIEKTLTELGKLPFELNTERIAIIKGILARNLSHDINMGCTNILTKSGYAAQDALPELLYVLNNASPRARGAVSDYLATLSSMGVVDSDAVEAAMRFYRSRNITIKLFASAAILASTDDSDALHKEVYSLLFSRLLDDDEDIRNVALRALEKVSSIPDELKEIVVRIAENPAEHRNNRKTAQLIKIRLESSETQSLAQKRKTSGAKSPVLNLADNQGRRDEFSIAVIIGNKSYADKGKNVPDVDYALNDAEAMYQYVTNVLGFKEGNVIYLKDALQSELVSVFGNEKSYKGQLYSWVRPDESDFFVFYSGHGAPGLKDGKGYLLPVDANPDTVELNGYPLETLYANLSKIPAKNKTLVIDACFSGGGQNGSVVKNASSISLKTVDVSHKIARNMNVLTAAGVSEVASWDTDARHGLFTSYFFKAIQGAADQKPYGNMDRKVDLAEVRTYINKEVPYMARRLYGREQNPQIKGTNTFVFSELSQ